MLLHSYFPYLFLPGSTGFMSKTTLTLPQRRSHLFLNTFSIHTATMLNNLHAKYKFEASVLTINAIIIYTTQSALPPLKNGAHRGRYLSLSQRSL
jgi:hypothetical protein